MLVVGKGGVRQIRQQQRPCQEAVDKRAAAKAAAKASEDAKCLADQDQAGRLEQAKMDMIEEEHVAATVIQGGIRAKACIR